MKIIAIVGSGPIDHLPDLKEYVNEVTTWIGVDRGALTLLEEGISVDEAVGDFDSINQAEKQEVLQQATRIHAYPPEKNETDLEIALDLAVSLKADQIYLFGVTGGRLDHALINIQLLLHPVLMEKNIPALMIDKWNQLELVNPGSHTVKKERPYPYVSLVPYTQLVEGISLAGFYYPLEDYTLRWGSTRCISNELVSEYATVTFATGKLLIIKSSDGIA